MTTTFSRRLAASASLLAILPALPALAEPAAADREYLPNNIIVSGTYESYVGNDGSSATKTPTAIVDVPQTVTVLTADQLEDQAVTSLGDALRFVPGVTLETGEGQRDEVFIRGQETTADFYLDGLRDDAQYYRSLYNIDHVEVLKGANALIFGRGAGGGAINRVSKSAELAESFTALSALADTFGGFALAADVNAPLDQNVAVRLNATYEEFDNHRDVYEGRFIGISPTLTGQIGSDTTMTFSYTYDDDQRVTDRGVPSLGGLPLSGYNETFFGDPDYNTSSVEANIARARLEHRFSSALSGNVSALVADYDKFYANIVPSSTDGTNVTLSGYESGTDRLNAIVQANLVGTFNTAGIGHTLLIGVEGGWQGTDAVRNQARWDGGVKTSVTVPLASTIVVPDFVLVEQSASTSELETLSAYVQEQLDLGIVQFVAGLRYDRFDLVSSNLVSGFDGARVDEKFSPRVGVIVKPQENLSIYASYAESFLPASGNQFTVLTEQSEGLRPESFENLEAGIKWAPHRDLLLTGAVFRLTRSNTPSVDPETTLTTLAGESRVEGFELGAVGEPVEGLSLSLGYTYLDGEIIGSADAEDIGIRLQQVPEHQVTAWARYDFTDRLGVGAGLVHLSDQFASMSNNVVLPAHTRVDAAVYFDLTDNIALQANVENLLDETYYASAHGDNNIAPGAPLNATFGARVKF